LITRLKILMLGHTQSHCQLSKNSLAIKDAIDSFKSKDWKQNEQGRGVKSCKHIQGAELTYTTQLALALDKLCFPDPGVSAILNQVPTRNCTASPECTDIYVVSRYGSKNNNLP